MLKPCEKRKQCVFVAFAGLPNPQILRDLSMQMCTSDLSKKQKLDSKHAAELVKPGYFSGWWLGHPSETYEFVNWDD